jgi:hypothetical protein
MSRVFLFLGLVTMGCGTQAESVNPQVTIDASAAPSTVLVEAYVATGTPGAMPIATPDILAGRAAPATTAMVWFGRFAIGPGYHGQPVVVRTGATTDRPVYVGVIGLGGTGVSGGAWSGPIDHPEDGVELKLDPALLPEGWGTQSESGECFRLNTGATTVFITRADDPDCDGLTGAQDRQPYAYCDPTATSGPARDACL